MESDTKTTTVDTEKISDTEDNLSHRVEDLTVNAKGDNEDAESSIPQVNETGDTKLSEEEVRKELETKLSEEEKIERRTKAEVLKKKGNEFFKSEEYKDAVELYTEALSICPFCYPEDRAILHSNAAACHQHLDEKEEAIEQCTKALELKPNYLKARKRRAQLYRQTEKLDESLQDFTIIMQENPSDNEARAACMQLPAEINERNEKMKAEMLGKLKDLGNLVLRPFGLSTDNFQMQKDPNSGGYSINFQQAPKQ